MTVKRSVVLIGTAIFLLAFGETLSAFSPQSYYRPNPYMDYVPQEIGIYDTTYNFLTETDCRRCHGNSLADRHHLTDTVVRDRLCTPCHDLIPDPPGVIVKRNCKEDGCHGSITVDLPANGAHHLSDLARSNNCTACHNSNVISEIQPFRSINQYPPSVVTPTPYSCQNCHWGQDVVDPDGDPFTSTPNPGHPSTFDHFNLWGQFIGYYEYGRPIPGGGDCAGDSTIHNWNGQFGNKCYLCHGIDPGTGGPLIIDPYNPENIRYCEKCHDIGTLHTIKPHVEGAEGWEAVGFHVSGGSTTPTTYRSFSANEMCFGCHADFVPEPPDIGVCTGAVPVIASVAPNHGACYTYVTIVGQYFGEEQFSDSFVQLRKKPVAGNPWIDVPVYSWTSTQIEFEIPCWTFAKGTYQVRVVTACGHSPNNAQVFALKDWGTLLSVNPDSGPCSTWMTLTGSGFGNIRKKAPDTDGDGIQRFVKVVSSQGSYFLTKYKNWTDSQFESKFQNMERDTDGDFLSDGTIKQCDGSVGTWLGAWEVYFVTLYYNDADASGDYTPGDPVYQTTVSDPEIFELTADPVIFRLNPATIDNKTRLRIVGQNFGPYQNDGEVHIGKRKLAKDTATLGLGKVLTKIKSWSNTQIKVKLKVPLAWQGKNRYVWIEKEGKKTNFKKIMINP